MNRTEAEDRLIEISIYITTENREPEFHKEKIDGSVLMFWGDYNPRRDSHCWGWIVSYLSIYRKDFLQWWKNNIDFGIIIEN